MVLDLGLVDAEHQRHPRRVEHCLAIDFSQGHCQCVHAVRTTRTKIS